MSDLATVLGGGLGAVALGSGGTYLIARYVTNRGDVSTAPADVIFAAGENIRADLTKQIDGLRVEVTRLTGDYTGIQRQHSECLKHNVELETRILHLEAQDSAAALISAAKVEAESIRAAAKVAADVVLATAVVAKDAL